MKKLLIMRHGKAEQHMDKRDFERQLVQKGCDQSREAAEHLIQKNLEPQWIISSAAMRALETAEIVGNALLHRAEIIAEQELYLCSVEELLQVSWICPDHVECLLLVGHNPTMEYLTDLVIQGDCRIKTSEIRSFTVHRNSWNGLSHKDLEYDGLIYSH